MSIRPFDWRDLPALYRYRNQSVFLHSSLVLTRGPSLIPGALLSSLALGKGIFTSVSVNNGDTDRALIGQAIHASGSQCAQLTFLAPGGDLDSAGVLPLLDHLSVRAIKRGAFRLLADVEESTLAFEALRRAGFGIYAWQRIWQLAGKLPGETKEMSWQVATERDLIAVRSLYHNLIPGLVQQVEPFPEERLYGLVYRQGDEILAYAELKYGRRGVWVQPFIHPDAEEVANRLIELLQNLPYRLSRPVYLCIRSYQSWLEPAIKDLGAESSPRQAMMVKHLAIPKKALPSLALPALNGGQPEITATITRMQIAKSRTISSPANQAESK